MTDETAVKEEILKLVRRHCSLKAKNAPPFLPEKSRINYAGRVYDENEVVGAVDACLEFWLTEGRFCREFSKGLAKFTGLKYCSLTNSGSSANLLAVSALTSHLLGEKRLKNGDRVITAAAGFPTTLNPIFQNGLVPRFIDVELDTYNPTPEMVEEAIDEKTKAIVLAHTLGNTFDAERIGKIAKEHGLYLVEDCCDALGSTIRGKHVGTFGDLATLSFYPAHHITTGEGGAVLTSNPVLKRAVESFRDWGRDCWCATGNDNTCKKRFKWKLGDLPYGYDHKYIYSHIGYNLKMLDIQGAIGLAQLEKLPEFVRKRRENWEFLHKKLSVWKHKLILPVKTKGSDPSPFGFLLTVRKDAGFTRGEIVDYLESRGIATRMLFGGNLTRQPAYLEEKFEVAGELKNSDTIMNCAFWVGVYPGLIDEMREYVADKFAEFLSKH